MKEILTYCGDPKLSSAPALILIPSRELSEGESRSWGAALSNDFKTYVLSCPLPQVDKVVEFAETLSEKLAEAKVRWATVCGVGPGANIAQALALVEPKLVRRLVLIDATTRLAPGFFTRLVDKIEQRLPLGLPLRSLSRSFDSRSMLHRIHRPVLVLVTPGANPYITQQTEFIGAKIPSAWFTRLKEPLLSPEQVLSGEFLSILTLFSDVPPKKPLKNAA